MTNYNDGKWHGWNGGECPVHPETVVDFIAGSGNMSSMWREMTARQISWTTHTGCFRVIKEHKPAREWWIDPVHQHIIDLPANINHTAYIHVREVVE